MTDAEATETETTDWDSLFANKLKGLSTTEIEQLIANALGGAVGEEYEATVRRVDFAPNEMPYTSRGTEIVVALTRKQEKVPF